MMRWMCLFLTLAGAASAQPAPPERDHPRPAPPTAEAIAEPGRPGWTVDASNGCWVWNPNPQQADRKSVV